MALKEKWKDAGKNVGGAFAGFGKAMGTTAKVVFTDEKNEKDENGDTKVGKAWKDMGKGFGKAGKSLGKAAAGTAKKVIGKEEVQEEVNEEASEVVDKK